MAFQPRDFDIFRFLTSGESATHHFLSESLILRGSATKNDFSMPTDLELKDFHET